jgi:A/G-specific adenine glycosylase
VVRIWSGLGYNRRALNLHRAARSVVEHYAGSLPMDDDSLRSLPGIGSYTARAVRSFAFGADVAAVDTNVMRVLSRCVVGAPLTLPRAQTLADRLVPTGQSWEFNQTMFDLGATVCKARPDCGACPLRRQCRWRRAGLADPDPWRASPGSPSSRPQSRFAGSDRQGRGRLLHALRTGPVTAAELAPACGWPDDGERADRIAADLVAEGFARWSGRRPSRLVLR